MLSATRWNVVFNYRGEAVADADVHRAAGFPGTSWAEEPHFTVHSILGCVHKNDLSVPSGAFRELRDDHWLITDFQWFRNRYIAEQEIAAFIGETAEATRHYRKRRCEVQRSSDACRY